MKYWEKLNMTAILIANLPEKKSNYLYLAADRRVTSGDKLISDNNQKVFVRVNGDTTRYYATSGDVGPTDYIIDKMESLALHHIQPFMFDDTAFKAIRGTFAAFVVEAGPEGVLAAEVGIYEEDGEPGKAENRLYMEMLNLDELKTYPRVLGSGGFHVLASFRALGLSDQEESNTNRVQRAFTAASSVILSINDTVDIFKFKIPKRGKKL